MSYRDQRISTELSEVQVGQFREIRPENGPGTLRESQSVSNLKGFLRCGRYGRHDDRVTRLVVVNNYTMWVVEAVEWEAPDTGGLSGQLLDSSGLRRTHVQRGRVTRCAGFANTIAYSVLVSKTNGDVPRHEV